MSTRAVAVSVVALTIAGALMYVASQNVIVMNLLGVMSYERTLDRYDQSDTTTAEVIAGVGASGKRASLLSAFFGLDDRLPSRASRIACEGAGDNDGMPVIFSYEVDVDTIEPGDFSVVSASGAKGDVVCLTMAPADDVGELRTALLVGQFGSINDQPQTVEVVGHILSKDQTVNFKGTQVRVTPLEAGPRLVKAEIVHPDEWNLGSPGSGFRWGGGTGCPVGTEQIVRVTWEGGVTKPEGGDPDDKERVLYEVTVADPDTGEVATQPFALGDLHDNDNNHKLCLDTPHPATHVAFPAGYLTDPRDDLNPATEIDVTP